MTRATIPTALAVAALTLSPAGQTAPRTHRLEATPTTVAYGYYWSEAKPVLADRLGRHHRRRHAADELADGTRARWRAQTRRFRPSLKAVVEAFPQGIRGAALAGTS